MLSHCYAGRPRKIKNKPGFPKQPNWFEDARGFKNLEAGLKKVGFSETETNGILGNNWYNFYKTI